MTDTVIVRIIQLVEDKPDITLKLVRRALLAADQPVTIDVTSITHALNS